MRQFQSKSKSKLNLNVETFEYFVNKCDVIIAEQIGKFFYENCISGHILYRNDKFNENDYSNLIKCYENCIDIKSEYVQYIWKMIHKSQTYHANNKNNNKKNQNENKSNDNDNDDDNKNWIKQGSYQEYCILIDNIKQKCKINSTKKEQETKSEWINHNELNEIESPSPPPPSNPTRYYAPPPVSPPNLLHFNNLYQNMVNNNNNNNNHSMLNRQFTQPLFLSNTSIDLVTVAVVE